MTMKKLIYLLALLAATTLLIPAHIQALEPEDYSEPPALSNVFITAVQASGDLDYVELYNSGSTLTNMSGWQLSYEIYGASSTTAIAMCSTVLTDYLLPKDYGLVARAGVLTDASGVAVIPDGCGAFEAGQYVRLVRLIDASGKPVDTIHMTKNDSGLPWARRGLTASFRTNNFGGIATLDPASPSGWKLKSSGISDMNFTLYNLITARSSTQIYTGGWYAPPTVLPDVRIVEILPRPENCSPAATNLACADYVKVWVGNGVTEEDLAFFTLRSDSGGRARTSSNGVDIIFPISDSGYVTVPIALSNDGGYVWLEDMYGAQTYDASIISYPSAESAAHEGAAWALDTADGVWKWTRAPRPDAPNYFVSPELAPAKATPNVTPAPCREGQERNPATNRCRSIVDASAQLVPCREGQERNPDTNRCRSVLAASSGLVPCAAGQERNPETNRCRKTVLTGDDVPLVTDVPSETRASRTGWIVAGVAVVGAGAYALYEWRDVLRRRFSLRRK